MSALQKLVIDIGTRQFEGNNLGLSYTAFSRATQLGDPEDIMTSALFFDGPNVKPTRLMNITSTADKTKLYKKVILRHKWVQHLRKTLSHWIIQKMKPMNYSLGPITSEHLLTKYLNFILSLHPKIININYSTLSPFSSSHSISLFATRLGHPTIYASWSNLTWLLSVGCYAGKQLSCNFSNPFSRIIVITIL
jgi:hypothetical protein